MYTFSHLGLHAKAKRDDVWLSLIFVEVLKDGPPLAPPGGNFRSREHTGSDGTYGFYEAMINGGICVTTGAGINPNEHGHFCVVVKALINVAVARCCYDLLRIWSDRITNLSLVCR
jgi:hypothetical protein